MFLNTINKKFLVIVLPVLFIFFIATGANAATTIGLNITTAGTLTVSGNASLGTVNGNTITTGTGTLTLGAGKTLTVSNTLTLAGTDSSTLNIGTGGTLGTGAFATIADYQTILTNSAGLLAALSDETGTGLAVFNNSPTFLDDITIGTAGTATGKILMKGTTSGTVTVQTADTAGTYTLTLPADDGTTSQFLQTDGLGVLTWATGNSGTVTSVGIVAPIGLTVSGSPITSSGNMTLAFDIEPTFIPFGSATRTMATSTALYYTSGTGTLNATTFVGALTGTASGNLTTIGSGTNGYLAYWNGTNSLTGIATTTLTATAPIALSQPISVIGSSASVLTCATASGSVTGCLSSTDWTTFNNKGSGTVTSVSVVTANGVSGSVATQTTTPAITLTLGAITPTTVNGLTLATSTVGFTIAGGDTSKILTVSNTLTLAGTDSSTLNIGTGGTLGTGAFATIANYATLADPVFTGSLAIPQGATPTVDAVGEIALDTTDFQLLVATTTANTPRVIPTMQKLWGATIASTSPDLISGGRIWLPPQRDGFDIGEIHCAVDSGTSVVINISNSGGTTDSETVTCAATLTSDTSVDTNSIYAAGSLNSLEVGTVTGVVDYLTFSVYGFYTRE